MNHNPFTNNPRERELNIEHGLKVSRAAFWLIVGCGILVLMGCVLGFQFGIMFARQWLGAGV